MAKKKKKTKRNKPGRWVTVDDSYTMDLTFSDKLENEPETLRRLGHRAIDLLVDAGHYEWLAGTVGMDLGRLADELVVDYVTKLIHEVRADGKGAARG